MEKFLDIIVKYAEILYPYIVAILPTLTAISTCTIICVKIIGAFKSLRKEVNDKTDLKEARAEMQQIIAEDRAIKRRLNKLITLESKVIQYDDDPKV